MPNAFTLTVNNRQQNRPPPPITILTADTELETHKLSMSSKTLHLLIYLGGFVVFFPLFVFTF